MAYFLLHIECYVLNTVVQKKNPYRNKEKSTHLGIQRIMLFESFCAKIRSVFLLQKTRMSYEYKEATYTATKN